MVGSLNIDLAVRVQAHPGPGETVLGSSLERRYGGKGANQAIAAARAGAHTALIGRIGEDRPGHDYRAMLHARGIDCDHVGVTAGELTGHALITVDDGGENSIVVIAGANAQLAPWDIDRASDAINDADIMLLQLEIPESTALYAARQAAAAGTRVLLNASPWTAPSDRLLGLADPVLVNEHENILLAGRGRSACVTLGAKGARWGDVAVPAPHIDPVDTTGAGDAFAGTLAAALAWGADPQVALEAAATAGAEACMWPGAQPHRPC
ncbi:ribokinase [Nonomuraea angiospora]|uniref:ribokinase n=1 Tax=Nonomuraea angiospora TaxID=46172 RepID=UPI0029BE20AB|nr:ribokinase [Nonomuraea angiospora]MDX3107941.1 ribokinase [Nonomuraea angiospora]